MTRMVLLAFLVLSSGPAYAEWVAISSSESLGGYTLYADPDTILRKGDLVKMWALYDYKTLQNREGDSFLSMNTQQQYDCAEERTRLLAYAWYSGNMGKGQVVYSDSSEGKWGAVAPGTLGHKLWGVACGKH